MRHFRKSLIALLAEIELGGSERVTKAMGFGKQPVKSLLKSLEQACINLIASGPRRVRPQQNGRAQQSLCGLYFHHRTAAITLHWTCIVIEHTMIEVDFIAA
jgi:hypothetical protein